MGFPDRYNSSLTGLLLDNFSSLHGEERELLREGLNKEERGEMREKSDCDNFLSVKIFLSINSQIEPFNLMAFRVSYCYEIH